jgi:hypothetical protein
MSYIISGISPAPFQHLFALTDAELGALNIDRHIADEEPGYPCRASLMDAAVGEELLLLNFQHLDAASPYQSTGPIFIRRQASAAASFTDCLPPVLNQPQRLFSVRAYDGKHRMVEAEVASGVELCGQIEQFLTSASVEYLHIHSARRGCYFARVDRG